MRADLNGEVLAKLTAIDLSLIQFLVSNNEKLLNLESITKELSIGSLELCESIHKLNSLGILTSRFLE